jgi:hypothetical protein
MKGSNYIALSGPRGGGGHRHHGGGGRWRGGGGGWMPYPFPVQYPGSELIVLDQGPPKPAQICNPTPPIKPVPGLYKNAKGEYCWPTPGMSGLGCIPPTDPVARARYDREAAAAAAVGARLKCAPSQGLGCGCTPSPSSMGLIPPEGITDWIGLGLLAYLGYKFFFDPHAGESRRARARDLGRRVAHHARGRRR